MKVAFITNYTELYGANRSLLSLIDGLSQYKVSAHVVAPGEGDMTKALQDRGVPVTIMPIQSWMSERPSSCEPLRWILWMRNAIRRFYRNLRVLPALVKQLRKWKIDVIHTNSSVIPIGALAESILKLGCPPDKVKVHHLGVEVEKIHYKPRRWSTGTPLRVLIASSFREKKGIPIAL